MCIRDRCSWNDWTYTDSLHIRDTLKDGCPCACMGCGAQGSHLIATPLSCYMSCWCLNVLIACTFFVCLYLRVNIITTPWAIKIVPPNLVPQDLLLSYGCFSVLHICSESLQAQLVLSRGLKGIMTEDTCFLCGKWASYQKAKSEFHLVTSKDTIQKKKEPKQNIMVLHAHSITHGRNWAAIKSTVWVKKTRHPTHVDNFTKY